MPSRLTPCVPNTEKEIGLADLPVCLYLRHGSKRSMGYEGGYTLVQRCASEFVATWMFIFLLESVLANKLLPKTKGHDIGFGWVAFGVGLACFLPVQYFGYISSMVNPAMALANCIAGVIDWKDWLPITVAQFAGAFLGGCTVWLHYLPHFATVPEPPPVKTSDELLRTRDYINASSLAYASYSTVLPPDVNSVSLGLQQFRKVMKGNSRFRAHKDEDILGRHSMIGRTGVTRRRSINESDLHERLRRHRPEHRHHHHHHHPNHAPKKEVHNRRDPHTIEWPMSSDEDEVRQPLLQGRSPSLKEAMGQGETAINITDEPSKRTGTLPKDVSMRTLQALVSHDAHSGVFYEPGSDPGSDFLDSGDDRRRLDDPLPFSGLHVSQLEPSIPEKEETPNNNKKLNKTERLHEASIRADQNAKLAVFATRPAVFVPVCNLFNEIIGTMLLTSGILMLNQRGGMIWKGDNEVYMHGLKSFWVGILVVCLVLCLGGPGIAINPARDLGPRVAHWVLPIAGKGPSEWYYGWIPVVGPFIGGAIGGVFYNLCDMLNESTKTEAYLDGALRTIGAMVNQTTVPGHVEL